MTRNNATPLITGAALTMAVGTAAYMMTSKNMKSQRKKMKKNANKAAQVVGDIVENMSYMMK